MRASAVDMAGAIAIPAQEAESVFREAALLEPRKKHMTAAASMASESLSVGRAIAFRMVHGEESGITLTAALAQRPVGGDGFPSQFVAVVFADAPIVRVVLEAVSLLPIKMLSLFGGRLVSPFLPCHEALYRYAGEEV